MKIAEYEKKLKALEDAKAELKKAISAERRKQRLAARKQRQLNAEKVRQNFIALWCNPDAGYFDKNVFIHTLQEVIDSADVEDKNFRVLGFMVKDGKVQLPPPQPSVAASPATAPQGGQAW